MRSTTLNQTPLLALIPTLTAALIVFVGYALRLWHLGAASISGDEVNSISFATRPFADLLAALATFEPHPPFYYSFLHVWLPVAGQSEFALRFPSVLFGTLGVASAYATGRFVGGRTAGIATAAVFALSQFSILQAQDGRMYAALQAWVALYLAGLVRYLHRQNRVDGLVVVVAGILAAYTHYDGLLVVALGVIPVALMAPPRKLVMRLRPFVGIFFLYLPWVIFARQIFLGYPGWMTIVPPLQALQRSAIAYSVGGGVSGRTEKLALIVLPCLSLIGLAALVIRRRWRVLAVLVGLGVLPFAVVIAGVLSGRPLYQERYLIVVTPAYFALAGFGLAVLTRNLVTRTLAWTALGALGVVALSAYFPPAPPLKPDFRATAALIEEQAVAPATIVMPAPQGPIVDYYLKGRLPTYTAPADSTDEAVAAALTRQLAGSHEAWFVRYSYDTWDNAIGRWLESNAFYLRDRWITQNHVVTYALAPTGSLEERKLTARVAGQVEIAGERSGPTLVAPGNRVLTGFRWTPIGASPVPPSLKVSLRLVDPWGQKIVALDRPLVNPAQLNDSHAPRVWQGALVLPTDAVPGPYRREAVFYDESTGQVLSVVNGSGAPQSALDLGSVTVEPSPATALDPKAPLAASAVSVGHGLYAQSIQLSPGLYTPDSRLAASFDWAAQQDQQPTIVPEIALQSAAGQIVASTQRSEGGQPYRLDRLRAGERVRERLELPLRTVAAAGAYMVVLRVRPDDPWATIGKVDVTIDPQRYQPPKLAQSQSALFDGTIRLVGATMPAEPIKAGATVVVALAWHADGLPTAQYTVFVHLTDSSGKPVAQNDSGPSGGRRPTLDWTLGEYVLDTHQMTVPSTLPAGNYSLRVGLYQPDTGQRAKVEGPAADGDEVELGSISISPH